MINKIKEFLIKKRPFFEHLSVIDFLMLWIIVIVIHLVIVGFFTVFKGLFS